MNANARFTHMQDGTQHDRAIIATDFSAHARHWPTRIVAHLQMLEGDFGDPRVLRQVRRSSV